jgi:hypothetical protein
VVHNCCHKHTALLCGAADDAEPGEEAADEWEDVDDDEVNAEVRLYCLYTACTACTVCTACAAQLW